MTLNDWLLATFLSAVGLWIGGAVLADLWLATARRTGNQGLLRELLPLAASAHAKVFMPLAIIACGSGFWFAWRMGLRGDEWWVRLTVYVYVAVLLVSTRFIIPEYRQLIALSAEFTRHEQQIARKLSRVCWVSRAEVLAISLSLWNVAFHLQL